jgi:dihydrofolate reductase
LFLIFHTRIAKLSLAVVFFLVDKKAGRRGVGCVSERTALDGAFGNAPSKAVMIKKDCQPSRMGENMKKISVFTNISLDGYFEGPGHDISGFASDNEAFSSDSGQKVDTLLFGHRTYEMMKFWSTPQAMEQAPEIAKFFNQNHKVVVSHTTFDPGWDQTTVISGDVIAGIKQLKAQPGGSILMFGSNELVVSLMQAGLIDEFQIVVNPVALSGGTPLFKGLPHKAALKLKSTRTFKSGAVLLIYEPAG